MPVKGQWFVQRGGDDQGGFVPAPVGRRVRPIGRPEALCGKVCASGGNCFVRSDAGDKIASWLKGVQGASR